MLRGDSVALTSQGRTAAMLILTSTNLEWPLVAQRSYQVSRKKSSSSKVIRGKPIHEHKPKLPLTKRIIKWRMRFSSRHYHFEEKKLWHIQGRRRYSLCQQLANPNVITIQSLNFRTSQCKYCVRVSSLCLFNGTLHLYHLGYMA
jgi:hypothetical protein